MSFTIIDDSSPTSSPSKSLSSPSLPSSPSSQLSSEQQQLNLRHLQYVQKVSNVLSNIYLGSQFEVANYPNYNLIINLDYPDNKASNDCLHIDHLSGTQTIIRIGIDDAENANIYKYLDILATYMHSFYNKKNTKILIHCHAGISRSVSIVIAYLMKYHVKSFDKAFEIVRKHRVIAKPNDDFIKQLKLYERVLNERNGKKKN
jgi:protein-tyrosine phosphatase